MTMIEKLDADAFFRASKRLDKSSGWKYQSQRFLINRLSEINALRKGIKNGTYEPQEGSTFPISENGHRRLVKSMLPVDAVCQHALVDEVLVSALQKYLIHDNGAGLKGKGISFTRRRLDQHIRWHYRRYGREGYVLLIDFRKYFDNIRHDVALRLIENCIHDKKVLELLKKIFDIYKVDVSFSDDPDIIDKVFNSLEYEEIPKELKTGKRYMRKSLGIGAPVAQITGIFFPTLIDTFCKTVKGIHCYDAYMDDRIIIHPDKQFLKELLEDIRVIAKALGIHINEKKTQIVKLSHGFTWLKTRYIITETGKITKKLPRDVVTRERRKLKKLARIAEAGDMAWKEFTNQYLSWRGDKKRYNAYHTIHNMDLLFKELIDHGRKAGTNHGKTNPYQCARSGTPRGGLQSHQDNGSKS